MRRRLSTPLAISFGAGALIGGTGLTVSSAWLITMASEHPPIMVLGVSIVLVRFFGISRSVSRYLERVISHDAIFRKLTSIRASLFSRIASQMRTHSIATSVKVIIDDVERAQEFYLRVTLPQWAAALSGATTLLLGLWINFATFVCAAAAMAIFALIIPALVRRWIDPATIDVEDHENAFSQSLSNISLAMAEAEVFGYAKRFQSQMQESTQELAQLERRYFTRISALQTLVTATLGGTIVAIAYSAYEAERILPIHISMGVFLALVGFEGYTSWFPNLFIAGKNRRAAQSVDRISKSEEIAPELNLVPTDFTLECRDAIPFWVDTFLPPINFTVNPGEVLVITGASGVGKSTLAASMLSLAPYKGSITVGGVEIKDCAPLTIVGTLQDGHIFNTSLRENLKIANPGASDEELLAILTAMELDEIDLDEILGEFGRALSGGEAKRLAIARALLSPAPIVILDEPLEHIDSERAVRLQTAILASMKGAEFDSYHSRTMASILTKARARERITTWHTSTPNSAES